MINKIIDKGVNHCKVMSCFISQCRKICLRLSQKSPDSSQIELKNPHTVFSWVDWWIDLTHILYHHYYHQTHVDLVTVL